MGINVVTYKNNIDINIHQFKDMQTIKDWYLVSESCEAKDIKIILEDDEQKITLTLYRYRKRKEG